MIPTPRWAWWVLYLLAAMIVAIICYSVAFQEAAH